MANVSDELLANVNKAFEKYYVDLSNQDQIFFGVGDVNIVKQDGTGAIVASWNKVVGQINNAAKLSSQNTFTAVNTFSAGMKVGGNINCMNDNSMIYLGKNSDIGLVKKQGTYGKLMVGSGTDFSVVKGTEATINYTQTQTEIFKVASNGNITGYGNITVPGTASFGRVIGSGDAEFNGGKLVTQSIELSFTTPYIDFHFNRSSADYTTRLIETAAGELTLEGAFMCKRHLYTWGEIMARNIAPSAPGNGTLVTAAPLKSMLQGRGGNGDTRGAYAGFYLEEQVGTEHRAVIYLDGYGRTDAWIFRAGGTISTGKGDVMTTGSDVRLKTAFTEPPVGAAKRINALGVCEYSMKGENRRKRGFIAQQVDKVDPMYTFQGSEQEIDGERMKVLNVDYVAIIADLVTTVQELTEEVKQLKQEINILKI